MECIFTFRVGLLPLWESHLNRFDWFCIPEKVMDKFDDHIYMDQTYGIFLAKVILIDLKQMLT